MEHFLTTSFSCIQIDYPSMARTCNSFRNYDDIQDSYSSFTAITDFFALKQDFWQQYAGPGHWNDPDMVSLPVKLTKYAGSIMLDVKLFSYSIPCRFLFSCIHLKLCHNFQAEEWLNSK